MTDYVKCKDCRGCTYEYGTYWCNAIKIKGSIIRPKRISNTDYKNEVIMGCDINKKIYIENALEEYYSKDN